MKCKYLLIYVFAIILAVSIPTIIKINNNHYEKLYKVIENEIIYSATLCIRDNICKENKITLKTLYDNKYMEKQVDPKTQEYYNEQYYVEKNNDTLRLVKNPL